MTTHQEIDQALAILDERGMPRHQAYPYMFRFLKSIGYAVRPPVFLPFRMLLIVFGVYFAIAWSALMIFLFDHSAAGTLVGGLVAGWFFGYQMANWFRRLRAKFDVPEWGDIQLKA